MVSGCGGEVCGLAEYSGALNAEAMCCYRNVAYPVMTSAHICQIDCGSRFRTMFMRIC